MASGEGSAWAPAVDSFHDTAAVWAADQPLEADESAVARADAAYAWLLRTLDLPKLQELLSDLVVDGVEVHRFANLRAINIVLPGALGRGVADSDAVDPQAKSLGEYLRSRMVDIPVALFDPSAMPLPESVAE